MIKKVNIPIFLGHLLLIQGVPFDEITKKYDLPEIGPCEAMYGAFLDDSGYSFYLIAVKDEASANAIVHEAAHVTHVMMLHRGMKPDLNNDEWENYLLAWIVKQCYKYFNVTNK